VKVSGGTGLVQELDVIVAEMVLSGTGMHLWRL